MKEPAKTPDKIYELTEMFVSIQGEGANTGLKSLFIRFAGCPVECPFCDTDFSVKETMNLGGFVDRVRRMQSEDPTGFKCVVLTGGEPLLQVDQPLLMAIRSLDLKIMIETSGTIGTDQLSGTEYVTCSPKEKEIHPSLLPYISEVKMVLYDRELIDHILKTYREVLGDKPFFIQPMDAGGVMNLAECYEFLMTTEYPIGLSLQAHKFMDVE